MSIIRFLELYLGEDGTIANGISFNYWDGADEIPADGVYYWNGTTEVLAVEFEQVP